MFLRLTRLPLILVAYLELVLAVSTAAKRSYDSHDYYVVKLNPGRGHTLNEVARALDVELVERVGDLEDHFLVRVHRGRHGLDGDVVLRNYDDLVTRSESGLLPRDGADIASHISYVARQELSERVRRAPPPTVDTLPPSKYRSSKDVAARLNIQDPLFQQQWHLINDEHPEHSMNVVPVWDMGFTGKGVITSLLDDGLDFTSEDLKENFLAEFSHDYIDHVDLPAPKNYNDHHGTRCAGQIGAAKNAACGMGIAYESKVAGVRILGGHVTDVDEALALNYGYQNVSIYSCSWGPPDNGKSLGAPSHLIRTAMLNGINKGREGKGSVFVFASGNGGYHGDQCNYDGYTNSIYSVTVASVDYKGAHPTYSESCAANMIVAYSSGGGKHIVTTDRGENQCTDRHGGTSAAAPNAAGVFALALQARPDLTWRDIQHLCVQTAKQINPNDPDWEKTALGRPYSYKYGFGALDGYKFVKAAQEWKLVKPQAWMKSETVQIEDGRMDKKKHYSGGGWITEEGYDSTIFITEDMVKENNFETLEHINVKVWISHEKRGDIQVELFSPNGVRSVLGWQREEDEATSGFPGWTFMSVKHWGENPVGEWTIRVSDLDDSEFNGRFIGWNMMFWGSAVDIAKAKPFDLPPDDHVFPPVEPPSATTTVYVYPSTTKALSHPTDHLPVDHANDAGDTTKPAAPPRPTSSSPSTWALPNVAGLEDAQKWIFGVLLAGILFSVCAAIYVWRKRSVARKGKTYMSLSGDDTLPMSAIHRTRVAGNRGGAGGREMYDAFDENEDEPEADAEGRYRDSDAPVRGRALTRETPES